MSKLFDPARCLGGEDERWNMQRKQPTSVAFDRPLTARLDREAARLQISRSELVRRIVARYFGGLDQKEAVSAGALRTTTNPHRP